jgi:hypothetical protein
MSRFVRAILGRKHRSDVTFCAALVGVLTDEIACRV